MDGLDGLVDVGDRHVEAPGHRGVAVGPVGVDRDAWRPWLLVAGGECTRAGILDGCEFLSGEGFEYLQVDEVPVARVLTVCPVVAAR